ncbi:hypothetical protein CLIB1423_04S00188 [[Candida] railenensis]|uniref:Uncharacterized protein n=1 Tax=[Candida] railenensis TaxID=45579 RepID=A0A9P0QN77_9ASCO|nr:hypothetical protein CLIB1423_04S00188 [[Candida] railenensis]
MSSPIFISNPSPGLSFLGIVRGFQLAIVGVVQGIQKPRFSFFSSNDSFRRFIVDFVIIELIIAIPTISLSFTVNFISLFTFKDYSNMYKSIEYVMYDVININFILLSMMSVLRSVKRDEKFFYDSLNYFDESFCQSLLEIEQWKKSSAVNEVPIYSPTYVKFRPFEYIIAKLEELGLIEANNQNLQAVQIYTKLIINNIIMGILFSFPRFGHVISLIVMLQNLLNVVSFTSSLLITLALYNASPEYTIFLIVLFNETSAMMHVLIVNPFFNTMSQFTSHERNQWIKSREGVLFGWSLFFTIVSKYAPRCTFFCVFASKISLAYLVTKVSGTPPQGKNLMNWTSSQIVWNKEAQNHVLNGDFVNDFQFYKFKF